MLIFDQLRKNDRQLRVLAIGVFSGLAILLLGLWQVQVFSAKRYQNSQINQSFRTVRIPAIRGKIFDATGTALAENRPSYNVNLYLDELRPYFQSQYARGKQAVLSELRKSRPKIKLSALQIAELGRQTRYQVVSNLVGRATATLQLPLAVNEKEFFKHYDQRLFVPMPVLSDLNPQQVALFVEQAANLPGFDLEVQPIRVYPNHATAAHLLGHLQRDDSADDEDVFFNYRMPDFRGVVGVESAIDEALRGKTGVKSVLVNSLGFRQAENIWTPAEAGENVYLTIDLAIQQAAERALRLAPVPYSGTPRGAVVVLDATNGDILALASSPAYDPNDFVPRLAAEKADYLSDPNQRPQINRAMQENYAPGSVFKIVVGLAGLEAGTLNPAEIYRSKGYYELGRGKIVEDTAGPGEFNFRRALVKSSNPYFIHEGLKLGADRIVAMAQRFHFGERTGILPRQETAGHLPTREWRQQKLGGAWFDGNTANLSIGQEVDVTPLQVAVMIAAIANGGKVYWPRLVARIEPQDPFSEQPPVTFPAGRLRDDLGVSRRSLDTVRDAMLADVEEPEGTGKGAFVPGMRICAKTGTAQIKQGRKTVGHTVWIASFAPYEKPRYVVVVMAETEQGGSGATTCAPVAQKIYLALQKREQQPRPAKPEGLARN